MRSLVFEGRTWAAYEELRQKDKRLHTALCAILKEMLRGDPAVSAPGGPNASGATSPVSGRAGSAGRTG